MNPILPTADLWQSEAKKTKARLFTTTFGSSALGFSLLQRSVTAKLSKRLSAGCILNHACGGRGG